jgi:hypothetical protein
MLFGFCLIVMLSCFVKDINIVHIIDKHVYHTQVFFPDGVKMWIVFGGCLHSKLDKTEHFFNDLLWKKRQVIVYEQKARKSPVATGPQIEGNQEVH